LIGVKTTLSQFETLGIAYFAESAVLWDSCSSRLRLYVSCLASSANSTISQLRWEKDNMFLWLTTENQRINTMRYVRPLKNVQFFLRPRKAKILTTGIHIVFWGLKFEPDTGIGKKGAFFKGLYGWEIVW